MRLLENRTKRKLAAGELMLGFGVVHLRTAATAMLAAATRHNWPFIDMEHGAMSVHEATQNGAGFVLAGNDHSYLMSAG